MNARALVLVGFIVVIGAAALAFSRRAAARSAGSSSEWPAGGLADDSDTSMLEVGPVLTDAAETVSEVAEAALDAVDDFTFSLVGYRVMSGARWLDAAAKPEKAVYVNAMTDAEARYGVPQGLGLRLMWQESRFNPQAFNARSGATGIMQIVPRWHPDVNAADPLASIDYGMRYLVTLYRQFGTWELALMAYNWGPGNVAKWLKAGGVGSVPLETQNYTRQILADVRATGVMS